MFVQGGGNLLTAHVYKNSPEKRAQAGLSKLLIKAAEGSDYPIFKVAYRYLGHKQTRSL
jgi:hypothetical protein